MPDASFSISHTMPPPDDFDASPLLHSQRVAYYDWGSGEIVFTPVAAFSKVGFLMENLTALDQGRLLCEEKDDITCLLAFLHEYRHYQQDFLTGLGHWDHVARMEQIKTVLMMSKNLSGDHTATSHVHEVHEYIDKKATYLFPRSADFEVDRIKTVFAKEFPTQNIDALARLLTTRRLLEADAVLYTFSRAISARPSERGAAALSEVGRWFQFFAMPELYADTLLMVLRSFMHRVLLKGMSEEARLLDFVAQTRMLLSVSFAHPDPDTLARLGHDPVNYLPGIRFIRMMEGCIKQMQALDEDPETGLEVEKGIIEKCGFPYPAYIDCEKGWLSYLAKVDPDIYPEVTAARRDAIRERLGESGPTQQRMKEIYSALYTGGAVTDFARYNLPLLMSRSDGQPQDSILTGVGFKAGYNFDRLRCILGWRLALFLQNRRPQLACPLPAGYCDARVERCDSPYTDIYAVPENQRCRIRRTCFDKSPDSFRF